MRVAIVNYVWDQSAKTIESTLERFETLTGWAEAIRSNGASEVTVFQRFPVSGALTRRDVHYEFVADRGGPSPNAFVGARDLHRAVVAFRPEVVHLNGLDHPGLVRQLARATSRRTVLVVQDHGGFDPRRMSAARKRLMRYGDSAP
jgi:hypothetical protein